MKQVTNLLKKEGIFMGLGALIGILIIIFMHGKLYLLVSTSVIWLIVFYKLMFQTEKAKEEYPIFNSKLIAGVLAGISIVNIVFLFLVMVSIFILGLQKFE